jgi:stearoyl-CoA desaturase (delta-9 desaturase)
VTIATHGRLPDERVQVRSSIPFFLVHLTPLALIFTGISTTAVVLAIGTYTVRMFFITAGYHRYFRPPQLQNRPGLSVHLGLRWRRHARCRRARCGGRATIAATTASPTPRDLHSPIKGFWWSHVGWILSDKSTRRRTRPR